MVSPGYSLARAALAVRWLRPVGARCPRASRRGLGKRNGTAAAAGQRAARDPRPHEGAALSAPGACQAAVAAQARGFAVARGSPASARRTAAGSQPAPVAAGGCRKAARCPGSRSTGGVASCGRGPALWACLVLPDSVGGFAAGTPACCSGRTAARRAPSALPRSRLTRRGLRAGPPLRRRPNPLAGGGGRTWAMSQASRPRRPKRFGCRPCSCRPTPSARVGARCQCPTAASPWPAPGQACLLLCSLQRREARPRPGLLARPPGRSRTRWRPRTRAQQPTWQPAPSLPQATRSS